jgi:hypothetical protein
MYHLPPCIVALPNKRVQSDAAAAAGYRGENWLCNALRIEADFGKVAARLTRRAFGLNFYLDIRIIISTMYI